MRIAPTKADARGCLGSIAAESLQMEAVKTERRDCGGASPSRKRRAPPPAPFPAFRTIRCAGPPLWLGGARVVDSRLPVRHGTGRGDPTTCRRCPHLPQAAYRRAHILPSASRLRSARYLGLHVTVTPDIRAKKSRIEAIRPSLMEVPVRAKPPEGNTRRTPMGGEMRPGDDAHMGNPCSGNKHLFASHPCKKSQAVNSRPKGGQYDQLRAFAMMKSRKTRSFA